MKRRDFLRYHALLSGGTLAGAAWIPELMADERVLEAAKSLSSAEKMIRVGCPAHNCGGRCLLKVFVRGGGIILTWSMGHVIPLHSEFHPFR